MTTTIESAFSANGSDDDPSAANPGMTRRVLLRRSAVLAGLTALSGPLLDTRIAYGAPTSVTAATNPGTLVVLSLRGGSDGLSIVVPHGDPGYQIARPDLFIPRSALLATDSMFGLHPSLAPLVPYWQEGKLGVVHAVGQANPTRSHFEDMAEIERAAPGSSVRTGWLDRVVGAQNAALGDAGVFEAMQVGGYGVPFAFAGPNPEMGIGSLNDFSLYDAGGADWELNARKVTALRALYASAAPGQAGPAFAALDGLATTGLLRDTTSPIDYGAYDANSDLHKALRDLAKLIKANVGARVVTMDFGDWDMHVGLGRYDQPDSWMTRHLRELSAGLAAFAADLGPLLNTTTMVTISEFGRRVHQNESGGVDHGHGNVMLLLGGGIRGGRVYLGPTGWPGLDDAALQDGDLAGTVDYRQVLAELLALRGGLGSAAIQGVFPGLTLAPLGVTTSL